MRPVSVPLFFAGTSLAAEAFSSHTMRAYRQQVEAFDRFAEVNGLDPWETQSVADYLSALCDLGKSRSTLKLACAALRRLYLCAGNIDLDAWSGIVKPTLRGAVRRRAKAGDARRYAEPLRLDELKAACRGLVHDEEEARSSRDMDRAVRDARDRAALVIAWLAALRRSELAALRVSDIEALEAGLLVTVRVSKTSAEPEVVALPRGAPGSPTCPLDAWNAWRLLAPPDLFYGPAFVSCLASNRHALGSHALQGNAITRMMRRALELGHVHNPKRFTAHSLRAGLATELAEAGVPMQQIANAGRWKRLDTVLDYARRARAMTDAPHRALSY